MTTKRKMVAITGKQQPRTPGAYSPLNKAQQGLDCDLTEVLQATGNHLGPSCADDENTDQNYAGYPGREEGVGDYEVGALVWALLQDFVLVFVQLPLAVLYFLVFSVKEFDIMVVSSAWGHDLGGKVNGRLGEDSLGGLAGGLRCCILGEASPDSSGDKPRHRQGHKHQQSEQENASAHELCSPLVVPSPSGEGLGWGAFRGVEPGLSNGLTIL